MYDLIQRKKFISWNFNESNLKYTFNLHTYKYYMVLSYLKLHVVLQFELCRIWKQDTQYRILSNVS